MSTDRAEWHADDEALRGLLDGTVGPVVAASLEAHVMRCDACRGELNSMAFDDSLERTWSAIRDELEVPHPGRVERLLQRCGMSEETGRLLAAVPAMRSAWLLGVAAALSFAGLAAGFAGDLGVGLFLLIAPLAPVAGVAAAFGDADPAHEMVITTPYSAARLLLLRTAAVLATCAPIAMLVGLTLPGPVWLTIAWLTPTAAGIAVTLALAPLIGLINAAVDVAVIWSALTVSVTRAHEPLVVVGSMAQLVCLALFAVAGAAVLSNSRILDFPRRHP